MMDDLSISATLRALEAGEFSAVELTRHHLEAIGRDNGRLGAYITVTEEAALAAAEAADRTRQAGNAAPLAGIPIAHKDIFCTDGVRTTAGSKILDNFVSPYDATVVERLKAAGTVMLGKTNMDEFAMGSSNETSYYGPARNPWQDSAVPGGSSGGSAAAVAARLGLAATGTDTGGSIRQPAAMCGVTGIKPTYGRVSRWGMIAFGSSLDQAGPITHSAEDAALLLNQMAGFDDKDSTSLDEAVPDFTATLNDPIEGLRIGICKEYFAGGLPAAAESRLREALAIFESKGAILTEISLPHTRYAVPAYYVIAPAECSANLSRFDGVRFGYRCDNPVDIEDLYTRSRTEGFGTEVKQRIMVGAFALSTGYYDAYYRKAQQVRRLVKNDFVDAFDTVDLIVGPVAPTSAFPIGEKIDDPIAMYLGDTYTIPSSLAGLPAMSVPAGFDNGLPVGLQIIGNYLDEARLLNAAHVFQRETDWHLARPDTQESA